MPTAEEGTCEVARPLISCLWRHTSLIRPRCMVCCKAAFFLKKIKKIGSCVDANIEGPLVRRVLRVSVQPIQPSKRPAGASAATNRKCFSDEPDRLCGEQCCCGCKQPKCVQLQFGSIWIHLPRMSAERRSKWHQDSPSDVRPLRYHVPGFDDTICMGSFRKCRSEEPGANTERVTRRQRRMFI